MQTALRSGGRHTSNPVDLDCTYTVFGFAFPKVESNLGTSALLLSADHRKGLIILFP